MGRVEAQRSSREPIATTSVKDLERGGRTRVGMRRRARLASRLTFDLVVGNPQPSTNFLGLVLPVNPVDEESHQILFSSTIWFICN